MPNRRSSFWCLSGEKSSVNFVTNGLKFCLNSATDVPPIQAINLETPTQVNPLGAKGVGEAGTVGGMAATTNAICNALLAAGIRHLDMPTTPLRV